MLDTLILKDVKEEIGPAVSDCYFDKQILSFIEIKLLALAQLGCIKKLKYPLDKCSSWDEIIANPPVTNIFDNEDAVCSAVRQYIALSAKLLFDPPVSGVLEIFREEIRQLEWRLEVAYDQ